MASSHKRQIDSSPVPNVCCPLVGTPSGVCVCIVAKALTLSMIKTLYSSPNPGAHTLNHLVIYHQNVSVWSQEGCFKGRLLSSMLTSHFRCCVILGVRWYDGTSHFEGARSDTQSFTFRFVQPFNEIDLFSSSVKRKLLFKGDVTPLHVRREAVELLYGPNTMGSHSKRSLNISPHLSLC